MRIIHILTIAVVLVLTSGCSQFSKKQYIAVGGYEYCGGDDGKIFAYDKKCPKEKRVFIDEVVTDLAPNANAITIWLTRDWKDSWYKIEDIQTKIIDRGYTPIFIFYWFADDISPEFVKQNKKDYLIDLRRMVWFLDQLDGEKIVILNPEFNENGIESHEPFNDLLIESINLVKQVKQTKVSFCIGDFGNYQNISDEENWKNFHPSVHRAIKHVDFITFQEMRGSTRNKAVEILKTPKRSLAFATYLTKTYHKPTFLAYLALPSYGENGLKTQEKVYQEYAKLMPKFIKQGNLIGFNSFHLMDVPHHVGYFKEAEKHFGLVDAKGNPKPALKQFQKIHF